ncbi:multidrug DMT transporter [Deinococcus psychrotolerans]|uniref:Multidrug DMT transporter n=1 Tax=Deinococcus psychrotolerans TaxID=2489213 RepID=A0A3G8YBS4_9DEIO|nr:multidrug DMT transporter [Deinococcus psychrotolerans]AZI42822.1 multidrug DMT transporter [Deinococcus psychrotolerans]
MDNLLKKAGAMTAHLELFQHMLHLRGLLQLAAHMEERGDRVTMVSPDNITLIGAGMESASTVTTTKGAEIESASAYSVLRGLKGHDAPEYAVTREELKALNARAVSELEASDAMRAFGETLGRISGVSTTNAPAANVPAATAPTASTPAPTETTAERPNRTRRGAEETSSEAPAA